MSYDQTLDRTYQDTLKEAQMTTETAYFLTPSEIAERLDHSTPADITVEYGTTGGGIMCVVVTSETAMDEETALYFGTAEGFLGWSDYHGEEAGSFPDLVSTSDAYRAWARDLPVAKGEEIVSKILKVIEDYFDLRPDAMQAETVRTCADKALTLIEMSELSDVLDGLENLDQLAERVDWNYFLAEACDHVTDETIGGAFEISHLNAVSVEADKMIQAHPRASQPARWPYNLKEQPAASLDQAWRAVHAQLEDLTPTEGLIVLSRVREDLLEVAVERTLSEHFAAPEPVEGLLSQLAEHGLEIREARP